MDIDSHSSQMIKIQGRGVKAAKTLIWGREYRRFQAKHAKYTPSARGRGNAVVRSVWCRGQFFSLKILSALRRFSRSQGRRSRESLRGGA